MLRNVLSQCRRVGDLLAGEYYSAKMTHCDLVGKRSNSTDKSTGVREKMGNDRSPLQNVLAQHVYNFVHSGLTFTLCRAD